MKKKQFKCTMLSDVVISESSATKGRKRSLDFIPGNNFLGIAAESLYKKTDERTWIIFHSGKVRFGDAHPSVENVRGLRIPAIFYYPKMQTVADECYVYSEIGDFESADMRKKQLKQCRSGFYAFVGNKTKEIKVDKNFAIKSAYNSSKRRAEDEKMFGYESIARGTILYFDVEFDDDVADDIIADVSRALSGNRHVGRSRSAQYGWIDIEPDNYDEPKSKNKTGVITVYADSRLIFFDDNGQPTYRPQPSDLGIEDDDAVIDWTKSQLRIFQYAPWNFTRQAFDNERTGIEKGSVFVVKTSSAVSGACYVGAYQNEGFGKIVYNPEFLETIPGTNGKSVVKFEAQNDSAEKSLSTLNTITDTVLIEFLKAKVNDDQTERRAYTIVKEFIKEKKNILNLNDNRFASQWGNIRSIAMENPSGKVRSAITDYISHGVAKDKWDESGWKQQLERFMSRKDVQQDIKNIMIELASQMQKKTRQ